ncbi:unnamed protein product [Clavelina lepadiformis]|uniref:Uncharacterized protein n=1 Tax=Clavelina lepadiformis TaxID=159417 RepID=A0ABP0H1I9_CLALP
MSEEKPSTCAITYGSKQPSSLGFLQLHWQIQNGQKRATEVIRQHLEKEESEWEYGLLKQVFKTNVCLSPRRN